MRLTHFAGKALAILGLGAAVVASTVTPALGLSVRPQVTPQFNGSVYAIAHRGSTVYVGGSFTSAISGGRSYDRQRLAAFDARTGALLNWTPTANATVRSLAVAGDSVYAAGDFRTISGWQRDSLARIDAIDGRLGTFAHTLSGTAYRLAVGNGRLYLGGSFAAVDGYERANLAAFSLYTGALDGAWRPHTDDAVHAIAVFGPRVYVGGAFHKVDDTSGTFRIAALTGPNATVDRGFLPRPQAEVTAITTDGTGVYVATGGRGGRAIAYTTAGAIRWQRVFDGDASSIATLNGVTYVGGHFDAACLTLNNGAHGACTDGSVPRIKLAAINTATGTLTNWSPQANGVIGVRTLTANPATASINAGGDFTQIDNHPHLRYAAFH